MLRLTVLALATLAAGPALAQFPCDELWAERNAVYKEAGYCFRTPRAIKAFGNAGCRYDELADVPLSARDRAKVAEIQREERRAGCQP
ncbi:YARHG domain-containing protein [Methylobacterium oryzihabitans]|uniref:YARHG domain-containing protein n=1 Tax=Methylobacterium oryzihabitans TaxID=2499852 RepID=A0A3S2VCU8_9HYPH|nr:YARHG domain-containing protein [Methylobacterium oryzihabitans]RVU19812.1 YARHG domain-containing protein [Methylobacterium oryzihabitans]